MKYKRARRHLKQELREIDYIDKLTPEEKEFLYRFYFEYYQADFDENRIHPPEFTADCKERYVHNRRQLNSVDQDELIERIHQAIKSQSNPRLNNRYYSPYDYALGVDEDHESQTTTETPDQRIDNLNEIIDLLKQGL